MTTRTIGSGVGSAGPGTVSTVGTTAVTGVGTSFLTTFASLPATIKIGTTVYDILSVTNNLLLNTVQTQGTNTTVAYTIGLRQYSSIAQWAAFENTQALTGPDVGQCFNDALFSSSTSVTIGGWTGGSATNTVTLTVGSGQGMQPGLTALLYNQANGVAYAFSGGYSQAFNCTTAWTVINGLQIDASIGGHSFAINFGAANGTVSQCLVKAAATGSSAGGIAGAQTIDNCFVYTNSAGTDTLIVGGAGTINILKTTLLRTTNNTAAGTGMDNKYVTAANVTDCLILGFTTPVALTGSGRNPIITFSGTDQATLAGTGNLTSLTPSNVLVQPNATTGLDGRAKAGSTTLDAGTAVGAAVDIVGTTRPQGSAYDMGCWELISTGPVANHNLLPMIGCG